ncbi:Coatomer_alpha subunit [Hexamita inflata]|uniref:Coatomer alpha subunit n=1 Tax=Hexamita inflata TaxID=28002 RepID=A0AA86R9G6_9EUKA|nr:Coatomer alpha subunit [Hexamita inflata]
MPQTLISVVTARVKSVTFHPRRPWVLVAMHDGFIEIWDYVVNARVDRILAHSSPVRTACFHPTQPIFATGADDRTVKLWDLDSRKCTSTMTGHTDYLRYLEFHPGTRPWLVSSSDDGTCRIWNWQSRQCLATIVGHREFVMCARFHPKDDLLLTGSLDTTVRVWDLSPITKDQGQKKSIVGQITQSLLSLPNTIISISVNGEAHSKGVNSIAWGEEDQIYSSADDFQVKCWRLQRGKKLPGQILGADALLYAFATVGGHKNNVNSVEIGKDNILVSASSDQYLRVYEAKSRAFVGQLSAIDLGPVSSEQCRFWFVSQHPTEFIWAAGHDQGFSVFKFVNYKPIPSSGQFFVKQHSMYQLATDKPTETLVTELNKNSAPNSAFGAGKMIVDADNLFVFGEPYPFIVGYNNQSSSFIQIYANSKITKPETIECAGYYAQSNQLFAYVTKQLVKICRVTVGGLSGISQFQTDVGINAIGFLGQDLLVSYVDGQLVRYDQKFNRVNFIQLNKPVTNLIQSPDGTLFAALQDRKIFIFDQNINITSTTQSATDVQSMVFGSLGRDVEQMNRTLMYANRTHIAYLASHFSIGGIVTSLNRQVFLQSVSGQQMTFFDDEGTASTTTFDSRLCGLMTAVADGRQGDAQVLLRRVKKSNLGVSAVSKLIQAGMNRYAVQLLGDEYSQLKASLSVDLGILENIDQVQNKNQLFKEAMLQNRGTLAFKLGSADQKAFVNALYNSESEIDYKNATLQEKLNAQILMNDENGFRNTLIQAGMHAAAKVFSTSRNLDDVEFDQGQCTKPISTGKKLVLSKRQKPIFDWPTKKAETFEPEEEEVAQPVKEKVKWNDEEPEEEDKTEPSENKETKENKKWDDSDESEHENEKQIETGSKLPPVLNVNSQAMKILGFSKDSQALQELIGELKEYVLEKGELPFTAQQLDKKMKEAHKQFTDGDFNASLQIFQEVFIKYKLLVAQGNLTQKQVQPVQNKTQFYMRALRAELKRKLESTGEEEHPQLLLIFAAQKLEPLHKILVLKLAMNKLKKQYSKQAKMCAIELIKLAKEVQDQIEGADDIISKAEKVLVMKDIKGPNDLLNQIDSLESMKIDYSKLEICESAEYECPCCGSESIQRGICTVCEVGEWM